MESQKDVLVSENRRLSSERKWADWVKKFGERIDEMSSFSSEEKREFLEGVLDSITVNTSDIQTHELTFKFKVRYINDELVWNDDKTKSGSYKIVGGSDTLKLTGELGKDLSKKISKINDRGMCYTELTSSRWSGFTLLKFIRIIVT